MSGTPTNTNDLVLVTASLLTRLVQLVPNQACPRCWGARMVEGGNCEAPDVEYPDVPCSTCKDGTTGKPPPDDQALLRNAQAALAAFGHTPEPPACDVCGNITLSLGADGYKCPNCGNKIGAEKAKTRLG